MKTLKIELPTIENCDIKIHCEPEQDHPSGHFASGDNDQDAEDVAKILADAEWNEWAWCCVKVTCEWRGLTGADYLGGCNYASEADFREGGYYEDMKYEAYQDLIRLIEALAERGEEDRQNARIACAAPKMLAALRGLLSDKYLADPINADRMAQVRGAVKLAERGEE